MTEFKELVVDGSQFFPFGKIEEKGYTIEAWQPLNDRAKHVFILRALNGEEVVKQIEVQMFHESRFGVDVEDVGNLEAATDKLIAELP
jgi:hypothetical protein